MIQGFCDKKIHFVQYGPWGVESSAAVLNGKADLFQGPARPGTVELLRKTNLFKRIESMTHCLIDWPGNGCKAAFTIFNMATWLHLDTAFGLIQQRFGFDSAHDVADHISMQSATPFVMSVPLKMSTIYTVAQWMRTPKDTCLEQNMHALVKAEVTDYEKMLNNLWHLFAVLFKTSMPFGFVHSTTEKDIAVFVTGPNAQFAGAIYSLDKRQLADARFFIRLMVAQDKADKKLGFSTTNYRATSIMERFAISYSQLPWMVARANEQPFHLMQLFNALVLSSKSIFVCWKPIEQSKKMLIVNKTAINMLEWRNIGSLVVPQNSAHFTFTGVVVEGCHKKEGVILQCREHSQLMLSILLANN